MSVGLRVLLIVVSLIVMVFVTRKIKRTDFVVEDSFFWIALSVLFLIISIFPKICYKLSELIGFESPSNFIFLSIIFLLLAKEFFMSVKVSKLQIKMANLIQEMAIESNEKENK